MISDVMTHISGMEYSATYNKGAMFGAQNIRHSASACLVVHALLHANTRFA